MALLSVSALGNCQTNGNPNVAELTKEQKEDLKKMYGRYQLWHHDFRYSGILRG